MVLLKVHTVSDSGLYMQGLVSLLALVGIIALTWHFGLRYHVLNFKLVLCWKKAVRFVRRTWTNSDSEAFMIMIHYKIKRETNLLL